MAVKGASELFEGTGMAGVDGGDSARVGLGVETGGFRGELIPDGFLIGEARTVGAHRSSHLRNALATSTGVEKVVGGLEFVGGDTPAASLDAGDWYDALVFGGHENGEIQDAILFGAEEFLSIDQKDGERGVIGYREFGDGAGGMDFGYANEALGDAVFEEDVILGRERRAGQKEGKECEIAKLLWRSDLEAGEFFTDGDHGCGSS